MLDDIKTKAFLSYPIQFKNYFKIYPPKIKDVIENPDFKKYLSLFTLSQEDIEDQLFNADDQVRIEEGSIPTPYQYLIEVMKSPDHSNLIKNGFTFFTHEELCFIPEYEILLIGNLEEILLEIESADDLPIFKEEDFFDFQNHIRMIMGMEEVKPYDYNMHPKKRRMLAKARLRDRIKAKKEQEKGTLLNRLASICCMGIGITPLNIGEMSYAAIATLTSKYQLKDRYDIDIRSLLAGASSKKIKPKYWMQEND